MLRAFFNMSTKFGICCLKSQTLNAGNIHAYTPIAPDILRFFPEKRVFSLHPELPVPLAGKDASRDRNGFPTVQIKSITVSCRLYKMLTVMHTIPW
jgi:hypothetical protein